MTRRTSWMDGQPIVVEAVYSVVGSSDSQRFPYRHKIDSLRQAVAIAKTYEGSNTQRGVGRISRTLYAFLPNQKCRGLSWMTHEWYVYADGRIERTEWCDFKREPLSPGQRLADCIRQQEEEETLFAAAAQRSTAGLSVQSYNNLVGQILETFVRCARPVGFLTVYLASPDNRERAEQSLVDRLNETLAYAGFRTLEENTIRGALQSILNLETAQSMGVLGRAAPRTSEQ